LANGELARALWRFRWLSLPGRGAIFDVSLLQSCARLFSSAYAIWGPSSGTPGQRVKIGSAHVRELLDSDNAYLLCAFDENVLVGYAIVLRFEGSNGHRVAWVAQLVVHETYRKSRVATTLLFSAWQFSDYDVWGLVTANPYAVRALETATRRPCRQKVIVDEGRQVLRDLGGFLDYLPSEFDIADGVTVPSVDTAFPIDLTDMDEMRRGAARSDRPWNLGTISEGHEWFAATFSSQDPSVARGDYLNQLLEGVDAIWIHAYEGMTLDAAHGWHQHAESEVEWILRTSEIRPPGRVLDAGCGDARHAVLLAAKGFEVSAVEISARLVERATQRIAASGASIDLRQADLRDGEQVPGGPFDLIVCVYDVLGSSADPADDVAILANLRSRIASGGLLVASVMNAASTLPRLSQEHCPTSEAEFVTALEKLPPSRQMERSGNVFNPEYIVYFDGRFYRKEQFDVAENLPPSELVIRDRRFTSHEIANLIEEAGFRVVWLAGVRAGRWDDPIDPDSDAAKEILFAAAPRE
jgi:2-polyprenyl-3-methyl-5-hydroxy-6-metoxy-1,4-benzoquinol methylase